MMTLTETLKSCQRAGIELKPNGEKIRVVNADRLTRELTESIQEHRDSILIQLGSNTPTIDPRGWEPEEGPHPANDNDRQYTLPVDGGLCKPGKPELLPMAWLDSVTVTTPGQADRFTEELSNLLGYEVEVVEPGTAGGDTSNVFRPGDDWDRLSDDQRASLENPKPYPPRCRQCGKHAIHHNDCTVGRMIMPIGKYKKRQIRTLATGYLKRLLDLEWLRSDLRTEIEREVYIRGNLPEYRGGRPPALSTD